MRGRCRSIVNRVGRSTSVPIAELFSPMIRSASQWPGTARSLVWEGRALIITSGGDHASAALPGTSTRHLQARVRLVMSDDAVLRLAGLYRA
jgi:hypothetical protein